MKWHPYKPEDSNGYVYVHDENEREICTCYGANAETTARLIAAMPKLLAACREALLFIETAGWNATPEDQEMTAQLREAIEAGTGGA